MTTIFTFLSLQDHERLDNIDLLSLFVTTFTRLGDLMPRMGSEYNVKVNLRIDEELDSMINAIAVRRGEHKAEVYRRLLRKAAEEENAKDSLDPIAIAVRKTMTDVLKPVEDRMAKINAKAAIASATAMYMAMQIYHDMGKDARALYEEARKRAVAFVKLPHDELTGDKDE
jgi:hypothetical protein